MTVEIMIDKVGLGSSSGDAGARDLAGGCARRIVVAGAATMGAGGGGGGGGGGGARSVLFVRSACGHLEEAIATLEAAAAIAAAAVGALCELMSVMVVHLSMN